MATIEEELKGDNWKSITKSDETRKSESNAVCYTQC